MILKIKILRSLSWNSIGNFGTGFINFIVTAIFARLLTPYDFGLIAVIVIFNTISLVIIESGFKQAVIRDKNASDRDLTSVFYANLFIASSIYLALFVIAPYIAHFYETEQLIWLSRFVFLSLVCSSFSIIQIAICHQNLNFKKPAMASIISRVVSAIIAVLMALYGFGIWALAVYLVFYPFAKAIILWLLSRWRPKGFISFISLKKYFSFGKNLLILGLLDRIVSHLESLLIGKVYTKSDLGYFSQARNFNAYIIQGFNGVITAVSYSALSQFKDNKSKLKNAHRKFLKSTMLFIMPISAFMIATSDNLITIIFGERWLQSAPYLVLWAICGISVSIYSANRNIFLVLGLSGPYLRLSFSRQLFRILAIILFVRTSIMALMLSIVFVTVFYSIIYTRQGGKLIDYTLKEVFCDLKQIIIVSSLSALSAYLVGQLFIHQHPIIIICLQLFIMAIIYCLSLILLKNESIYEIIQIIKSILYKKEER